MTDYRALCAELAEALCGYEVTGDDFHLIRRARAALAEEPAPPAEGEVAELVAALSKAVDGAMAMGWEDAGLAIQRAADLLEQRHPAPVPVAEPVPAPPAEGEVGKAALVRRMCEIILGNTFGNEELDSLALLVGHHPDVLNALPAPVPVAEGEMAELALKELEQTVVLLMPVTGHKKIKRFDTIRAALKRLQVLENKADLSTAPVPAEGEVAELVARLRRASDGASAMGWEQDSWIIARAADLLEQRHPAPVPVSERLPGPEDLDDQRRCWWLAPETDTKCGCWCLGPGTCLPPEGFGETHWLPATALPIPAGEVE